MGFSCSIYQGKKDLTSSPSTGGDGAVSYKLFGLGPSHPEDTEAPYGLSDFRSVVSSAEYADRLKDAAQDCFLTLQTMAQANLASLNQHHCHTCTCQPVKPKGWDVEAIKRLLEIDPKTITKINGGY